MILIIQFGRIRKYSSLDAYAGRNINPVYKVYPHIKEKEKRKVKRQFGVYGGMVRPN